MSECTIVVPCYNEAARLELSTFLDYAVRHDANFLFVNDGSSDTTGPLLDELCNGLPDVFSAVHLPSNRGKAEAVRRGVLQAFERRPRYIGYWDADLATPLDALGEFRTYLDAHPQVELLLGARVRLLGRHIERRTSRHLAGRLFAACASSVLGLPVYDTQCGAKLFRATPRMQAAFADPFRSRWIFDVELLARVLTAPAGPGEPPPHQTIHEWPLTEWRDVAGSKLRPCDFVQAVLQLADIYRHYRPQMGPRLPPTESASGLDPRPAANSTSSASPAAVASQPQPSELESVR